jgi:hypothetical protein
MSVRPSSLQFHKILSLHSYYPQKESSHQVKGQNSFQGSKQTQELSNLQQASKFLIEIIGVIPRQTLIRKLLLLLFPRGKGFITIRKIQRHSNRDLLLLVGANINMIKQSFTETIKY